MRDFSPNGRWQVWPCGSVEECRCVTPQVQVVCGVDDYGSVQVEEKLKSVVLDLQAFWMPFWAVATSCGVWAPGKAYKPLYLCWVSAGGQVGRQSWGFNWQPWGWESLMLPLYHWLLRAGRVFFKPLSSRSLKASDTVLQGDELCLNWFRWRDGSNGLSSVSDAGIILQ